MSFKKFLTALCLTVLATASAEAAGRSRGAEAAPPQLYALEKAVPPRAGRLFLPDAAEEFLLRVDPATVAANPPVLTLDLPGHAPLEAVRTRFVEYGPDWKSWIGTLRTVGDRGKGQGYIHLGYHGDQLTALIDFEGEHYRIAGGRGESHRLLRLSGELSPLSCGLGMDLPADAVETGYDVEGLSKADEPIALQTAALGATRIDVLVVYPREFFTSANASAEASLPTFVQDSISLANDAFTNSGIDAHYNLVGVVPLVGSQPSNGVFSALRWLDPRTSTQPTLLPPQEIRDLRDAFGADIVTLYIPFGWNADNICGAANLPMRSTSTGTPRFYRGDTIVSGTAMGDRAFSVNRYNCGLQDYTLGHEIAHNYGMHHNDVSHTDTRWLYPYGRGKVLDFADGSKKATVMACHCTGCACLPRTDPNWCAVGSSAVCNRIPYFSDPTRTYNGVVLGSSDPADPRDNARVGREQVGAYSNLRAQVTNTPPNASFTVSCTGRSCSFNASGSTDNLAIPVDNYWWDFGDGSAIARTARNVTYTYATAGSKRVHLVVKDSGGKTDVVWGTASPTSVLEGNHDSSNCRAVEGWAWDGTPSGADAISVDIYRDSTKVATVVSNLYRQDLALAGKGDGFHAFNYTPNSSWFDGQWHTATVKYAGKTTSLPWTGHPIICGARIFSDGDTPAQFISTEGQVYTVAMQFSSNRNGYISELGFYRAAGETGTNTLRLYSDGGGTPLASVTTSCSSSGWCWGSISPVAITAGTRYRVTVNTNTYQSKTGCGIGSGITNDPLTAHNGYWIAGTAFPTGQGACNSNFFLDVKFQM